MKGKNSTLLGDSLHVVPLHSFIQWVTPNMETTLLVTALISILLWMKTKVSAQKLPDFVGFSYSRADVSNPSSQRFISLLNEVNAIIVFRTKPEH